MRLPDHTETLIMALRDPPREPAQHLNRSEREIISGSAWGRFVTRHRW